MVDSTRGDSTCSGCGQVLQQRPMDETHDWRNFADSDQDNARASFVDPYAGGQMTTRFAAANSKQSQSLAQSHNKHNLDTTTRNLMEANDVITALGNTLNLTTHIQSKAKDLYREYEKVRKPSQRKASCRPLMVAIIYVACNQEGFGRTIKDLAKSTGVQEKELRTWCNNLTKILPNAATPPLDPGALVDRFSSRLATELPEFVKIFAAQMARKASAIAEGRQPSTIAAGALMLAVISAEIKDVDFDAVARATGTISGSTVQSGYNQLAQHKKDLITADFLKSAQLYQLKQAEEAAKKKVREAKEAATKATAPTQNLYAAKPPSLAAPSFAMPTSSSAPMPPTEKLPTNPSAFTSVPGVIPTNFAVKAAPVEIKQDYSLPQPTSGLLPIHDTNSVPIKTE